MLQILPPSSRKAAMKLQSLVLRGFGGGLNAVADDISMEPRFQVDLVNFRRTASGSQRLRFGSNWLADVKSVITGNILNMEFFAGTIICVSVDGKIAAVDPDGTVTKIWDSGIAALLPGTPAGWSGSLTFCSFVPYKSTLIVHNGIDKPISISSSHIVTYLKDAGTGSNVNVPIGHFGCVVSNYHCVAGLPSSPTLVYVSAAGTSGTFPGDPAPNDSISFDVGAYAPSGAPEIRGIAGFRTNLLVFFQDSTLVVKLGVYNDAATPVHVPEFPDSLPAVGLLGYRCIVRPGNDLIFAGLSGISDAKRELFSGLINSDPLSSIVGPAYLRALGELTDTQMLNSSFMVHDKLLSDIMLFLPGGQVFVYSYDEKLRYRAWSTYEDLPWSCGCRSFLGRTFYASGSRVFQAGNSIFAGENYYSDRLNDRDNNWLPSHSYVVGDLIRDTVTVESYRCIANNISGTVTFAQDRADQVLSPKWEIYTGTAIDFRLETPWLDSRDPMEVKHNKYIQFATKGTSEFTCDAFVDNLYKDDDGDIIYDPAASMDFIGNDAPGFGFDAGPYGGGRRSRDPRLFKFPLKFKTIKLVLSGATQKPLEMVNAAFLYAKGRYHR